MSLKNVFKAMLAKKARTVNIFRDPATKYLITLSPTNYTRQPAGPAETVFTGFQFIVVKDYLDKSGFTAANKVPRRGDMIEDVELGILTIDQVEPMYELNAVIVGYRLFMEG